MAYSKTGQTGSTKEVRNVRLIMLVLINEISIDELDALMTQIGYAEVQTNYYYFVKPGMTLDDGLYSFREAVNLDMLKEIVEEHKLIDVYVEISKTRLELSEMSPQSIKTVFLEMDEPSRKIARSAIQSCCRRLVLDDIDNDPYLNPFM